MRKFTHSSYATGNCEPHFTDEETSREMLSDLLKVAYLVGGGTTLSRSCDFFAVIFKIELERKQDLREEASGSQVWSLPEQHQHHPGTSQI